MTIALVKAAAMVQDKISINEQLQIEHFISERLNARFEFADTLWSVIDNTVPELNYHDCIVYLFDENRKELRQCAAYGPKRTELNQVLRPMEIPIGRGIVGNVAKIRKPIVVSNTCYSSEYIIDIELGMSEIAVPIIYNDQLIGVIDSESPHVDYYCGDDILILTELAAITANALDGCLHRQKFKNLARKFSSRKRSNHKTNNILVDNMIEEQNFDRELLTKLTNTQKKVLYELSKNKTSKQIADSLHINFRTVQVHRQNICTRLGLKGPNALLHFASKLQAAHHL